MSRAARESEASVHGAEERPYTWLEDYLERLEGKEARLGYYEYYPAHEYYSEAA